ncbi:site-specific integrase [Nonomuraea sp. NPDC047529]|uniref:site-specific integrase n=1 Tax=Nonomuraea sp. NPDC047529 TaxID=3155623 RepID=UPI0033D4C28F
MITNGLVDRVVHGWIADECSRSTVKNSLAILVRVMEQAVRDGIIDRTPARVTGWQREYKRAEDELDDPRALALPNRAALERLAQALVERSRDRYQGWGDIVIFAACTAARIGQVSGVRVGDIDTKTWTWTVRRQTTPSPGGLADKGTKGKRARKVPIIAEIRGLVTNRLAAVDTDDPEVHPWRAAPAQGPDRVRTPFQASSPASGPHPPPSAARPQRSDRRSHPDPPPEDRHRAD